MQPLRAPVTPESVAPATRRRVVVLVVGVLVFAAALNAALLVLLRGHPTNGGHWLIHQKWELLARTGDVDTLVLGDSTCNQGVRPDVWRERFGGTVVNLCTIGDMLAVDDVWMLEEYLRHHAPPRHVVIVHTYDMWQRDANARFAMLLAEVPRRFGFWKDSILPLDVDLGDQALVIAGRWFPLYSDEQNLRLWLSRPSWTYHHHEGFHISDDGYMAEVNARPAGVRRDADLHRTELGEAWHASEANAQALAALAALATKYHLDVVIAPAPIYDGLWADPQLQRRFGQIQSWIRSAVHAAPTIRVIEGPPITFSADQMTNVDHVIDAAAIVYTRWLVDRVR